MSCSSKVGITRNRLFRAYAAAMCSMLLLVNSCRQRGPVEKFVSVHKLARISLDMEAGQVVSAIGKPSFTWPRESFIPQGYPNDKRCKSSELQAMWMYYAKRGYSACVYFDAG